MLAEAAAAGRCAKARARAASRTAGSTGTRDRHAWLAPGVSPELERASEAMPTRLYRVAVEVAFPAPTGGERKFALASTRIGPRESR